MKSLPKAERRWRNGETYTVIRRAMITREASGGEGNGRHAGVRSGREGFEDAG